MLDSDSPVQNHEVLLRVVPGQPHLYDFSSHSPLPTCLYPSQNDPDGLSMYRRRDSAESPSFLNAAELKASQLNPATRNHAGVAGVRVDAVTSLARPDSSEALRIEASYRPDDGDLPGHVLLPDLSRAEYLTNRDQVRELAFRLSQLCVMEIPATLVPPKS